ncbi:Rab-interacting lysosomal protein [Fukomys damarensis]|uniref:Rab-interacting lysosomal protein n=1 Tax=Fukomys damarensis TaxID=885580 RepID=A0A091DRU1_FUKDA|nr:Rab-interacting lysosomal protein [Fukomys damarensis]
MNVKYSTEKGAATLLLQRLLLVNVELRHKLAAVQAQLQAAQDRERERKLPREGALEPAEGLNGEAQRAPPEDLVVASRQPAPPAAETGQCGFSREELEQILQERNELKTKVFLLKEELAYFQRELLTDHRVPGLLLEAMKITVRKQRKKIKAKMLGTLEEAESSFGLWYRGEAEAPQAEISSTSPSKLCEEEVPHKPHLEPVGSPQAPTPESPSALTEHPGLRP